MPEPVILLGLGFTTRRLARRFLLRRIPVFAAVRRAERFHDLRALGVQFGDFPRNAVLVDTVPPLALEERGPVRELIQRLEPRRIVYISSTGVYGSQTVVNEDTQVLASDEKARQRIDDEEWLAAGPWESLIIRPAAIYGPGRGVHVRIRERRLPRSESGGITSRIHADDLAAVVEAGALSSLAGAWPLADDYPCATAEIAAWCARVLRMDLNAEWRENIPVWGRRVDGRKIRELLDVGLRYPRYDSGILACLAEEMRVGVE
jgi:nucleoside-diphosphate-sugar epimerase